MNVAWLFCLLLLNRICSHQQKRARKEKTIAGISAGTLKNHTHNCQIQTKANDLFEAFAKVLFVLFSLHCVLFHRSTLVYTHQFRNYSAWDSSIAENIMPFDDNKDSNGNKNNGRMWRGRCRFFWVVGTAADVVVVATERNGEEKILRKQLEENWITGKKHKHGARERKTYTQYFIR